MMSCNKTEIRKLLRDEIALAKQELDKGKVVTATGKNLKVYQRVLREFGRLAGRGKLKGKDVEAYISLFTDPKKVEYISRLGSAFTVKVQDTEQTKHTKYNLSRNVQVMDAKPTDNGIILTLKGSKAFEDGEYTFEDTSDISTASTTSTLVRLPGFMKVAKDVQLANTPTAVAMRDDEYRAKERTKLEAIDNAIKGNDETLGSKEEDAPTYSHKDLYTNYEHGDTEHMKRLVQHMDVVGKTKETKGHMDYLLSLVDRMQPRFFKKMDVFITEAETAKGWVSMTDNAIVLGKSNTSSTQSDAEVVVHEFVHTMTSWALRLNNPEVTKVKRQLAYVQRSAIEHTVWSDFLGKPTSEATEAEIAEAKRLYSYIFTSKNATDELIAHALTNKHVMAHFKTLKLKDHEVANKSIFQKILSLFSDLMDVVLGNYEFNAKERTVNDQIHALAFRLAELNTKTEREIRNRSWFTSLYDVVNKGDTYFSNATKKFFDEYMDSDESIKALPKDASNFQLALNLGKILYKSTYNVRYRNLLGTYLSFVGIKPTSFVRSFFRDFFKPDDITREVEYLGLANNKIDNIRNSERDIARKSLLESIKGEVTDDEQEAITTAILETNAASLLFKGYTYDQLKTLLQDTDKLEVEIAKREKKLKDLKPARINWVLAQARGLGSLMATHVGTHTQNTNPFSIAIGLGTKAEGELDMKGDKPLEEAIEVVATLHAIRNTDTESNLAAARTMEAEPDFVNNVINSAEAAKTQANEYLFKDDPIHRVLGYTKELFDDTLEMEVAAATDSKKEEMKARGFKFVGKVQLPSPAYAIRDEDGNIIDQGIYVSDTYARPERLKGAITLRDVQARGTKLSEAITSNLGWSIVSRSVADSQIAKAKTEMLKANLAITKGTTYKGGNNIAGVMPLYDGKGKLVDFRFTMSKKLKKELLGQDKRVTEVLPRTLSATTDKYLRVEQDKEALKLIKKHTEAVKLIEKTDEDMREYAVISSTSTDELKQIYNMLPHSIRTYADSAGYIAVPHDLLDTYFGYRHLTLSQLPLLKHSPAKVKHIMNLIESYWNDLIKIAKSNILLKMPVVLRDNVVSNIIFEMNRGTPVTEVLSLYGESFRDVKAFMKYHNESIEVKQQLQRLYSEYHRTGTDKRAVNRNILKLETTLKVLENNMDDSPIKELYDAGLYQSVEEVETAKLNDTNVITTGVDKVLGKAPVLLKKGLQWTYLTQETQWYQTAQEFLQLSDLVARDVRNRVTKQREKEMIAGRLEVPHEIQKAMGVDVPEGVAMTGKTLKRFKDVADSSRKADLLDSFINYIKPNSKFEEWLNRLGLIMFTKYLKRIQHVIASTSASNPISSAITLIAATFTFDLANIQDSYLPFKDTIVPIYSPWENVMNVVTPAIIKPELYMQ